MSTGRSVSRTGKNALMTRVVGISGKTVEEEDPKLTSSQCYLQLGNSDISVNNPNPETVRTNSTAKCRVKATSKGVGRVEMWWGAKWSCRTVQGGKDLRVQRGKRNRPSHWGAHTGKMIPHNIWL